MTKNQLTNAALDALGSRDQLKLLDLVDSLRSQGVSSYLSLPQIIVCGDQSSGKSSVLEAISGVPFPVKSSVCTRFPTELILRKTPTEGISISIVPHHSRSDVEKQSLAKFKQELVSFAAFPQLVEVAKLAMGILSNAKSFSEDILRIEINGPNRPSLTIVDLPGLVHSENKNQTTSDIDLITSVVKRYMKEPRSIILAVISAKNDFANQIVLKLAKNADPRGVRTLGIITKPDTLNPGSESEKQFLSLARNQDVGFSLGWHVLRNADTDAETLSLAERDVMEEAFFSSGAWSSLPASQLGIKTLRDRLSKLLVCQIGSELPNMVDEIEVKMRDCQSQLDKLGMARNTPYEQRLFLIHISQTFQTLVKGAVDGMYNDPYFGDAMSTLDYQKRIRAVVQNMNEGFGQDMRLRGKKNRIVSTDESDLPKHARGIPRDEYMDHIVKLIERERGCELPGLYNPMIISHLFREQCQPWRAISEEHVKGVFNAVQQSLSYLVAHVTDAATVDVIMGEVIRPGLDKIQTALREKLAELLKSHYSGHPITYNHYFTETLKEIREDRRTAQIKTAIKKTWGLSDNEVASGQMSVQGDFATLISALMSEEGGDMNRFAAGEALDCLEAYYKVAMKRFIDDVAVEVVEECVVSKLAAIFSPMTVAMMSEKDIARIASETAEIRASRESFQAKLSVLKNGEKTCRTFIYKYAGDNQGEEYDSSPSLETPADTENTLQVSPPSATSESGTDKAVKDFPLFADEELSRQPEKSLASITLDDIDSWRPRKTTKKKKTKTTSSFDSWD